MADTPQRPYVPHRTPARGQPALSSGDFSLSKPFVPGTEETHGPSVDPRMAAMSAMESVMPSIESFLASAKSVASSAAPAEVVEEELEEQPEELPPLEHFLDPLPPISDFADAGAEGQGMGAADFPDTVARSAPNTAPDADWVETDWQRYDWQSVASLGDTQRGQVEASDDWATTDWELPPPPKSERGQSTADAIATALDQIAERIRKGDLAPGSGGVADPATIAATLAALLGVRR